MKIHVDRLSDTPSVHRFEADDPGWVAIRQEVPELAEGASAEARVHRMGQDVYLEGSLEGALELECGRCLVRYRQPLREPFRLVLEPAGSRVPPDPQAAQDLARLGMCLGDELELGWFQGHEIDLRDFLREVIALALPVQPLCSEACKGLCPRCGVDRNNEACACESDRSASPFAALEALRRPGRQGES